ncbi:MAG: hypothetical protein UY63_C0002G0035, partial [Parcubacteria group bacterium GW2011_GWA2_51_10]
MPAHTFSFTLPIKFFLSFGLVLATIAMLAYAVPAYAAPPVTSVQSAEGEAAVASATFGATPAEGNLLVAISFHRGAAGGDLGATPAINGESVAVGGTTSNGWTLRVLETVNLADLNSRRAMAVWDKVAGAVEPTNVQTSWSQSPVNKLIIREFSPMGGEIVFAGSAKNSSGTASVTSLNTGATAVLPAGNYFLVTALGVRNSGSSPFGPGAAGWTNSVGNNIHSDGGLNGRTLQTAFGQHTTGGAKSSTASWANARQASAAIAVYAIVTPSCPLQPQAGRTIVILGANQQQGDVFIRSDQTAADAKLGPAAALLAAGTYNVTLASYDDHVSKPLDVQPNESWFVRLYDAGNTLVAFSNAISDLPNNQDTLTELVQSGLVVSSPIASLDAFHAVYPDANPNSIVPICVAFDEAPPPP